MGSFNMSINFLWNSSGSERSKEAGLEAFVSGSGSESEIQISKIYIYGIQPNYCKYTYKCRVKQLRSLLITAHILLATSL